LFDNDITYVNFKEIGLGVRLVVNVPRPGDSEGTFSVFESRYYLLLPV